MSDIGEFDSGDHAFTASRIKGQRTEPMYSGALSFMRRLYSRDLSGVDVAVTGIPFDLATSHRPGARLGPQAIRRASANLAWAPHFPSGISVFDKLSVIDYGDLVFDPGRPHQIPAQIEAHAAKILATGASMVSLGGDHFVSHPLLKAHAAIHGPVALIHFDAHSDTWVDDDDRIDHGTMFYHAAKQGLIDPARSIQIGLRTYNPDHHGYHILEAPWVHNHGPAAVIEQIKATVGDHKAYLSFDIDGLDPAFAPGTGTPVVGGLSTAQALEILRGLGDINWIGMDVVEVAPPYDVSDITALAAATLAFEYLCLRAGRAA
jgi:agmatinase